MDKSKVSEALRKSIHICSLGLPLAYRYIFSYNRFQMFVLLLIALITALGVELSRIQHPTFRKTFHKFFGLMLRRHEIKDFTGATFLIFACLLCIVFFPPKIAFLAMSFLSLGDTFAAMVGITYGKRNFIGLKKTLEGSLGCFASIMIFSFFMADGLSPWVYTIGALTATLAELWRLPLDDNVKIPLISGLSMTFMHIIV
jgi:dolichol kinase